MRAVHREVMEESGSRTWPPAFRVLDEDVTADVIDDVRRLATDVVYGTVFVDLFELLYEELDFSMQPWWTR